MEYGCFVELLEFETKPKGLVHLNNLSLNKTLSVKNLVKIGDLVWVKIISIKGSRLNMSMSDVDQNSGKDIKKVFDRGKNQFEVGPSISLEGLSGKKLKNFNLKWILY